MNKPAAYSMTMVIVAIFGVFFIYPVAMTLAVAFEDEHGGFTMEHIIGVFRNPVYVEGLWRLGYR